MMVYTTEKLFTQKKLFFIHPPTLYLSTSQTEKHAYAHIIKFCIDSKDVKETFKNSNQT